MVDWIVCYEPLRRSMSRNLFDFSDLTRRRPLCRVSAAVVNTATVTKITDDIIECYVEPIGQMRFDRFTGVHLSTHTYGFIINCKKPLTKGGLAELKNQLRKTLSDESLNKKTYHAIEYVLRDPKW
jgi:hypothetical protein